MPSGNKKNKQKKIKKNKKLIFLILLLVVLTPTLLLGVIFLPFRDKVFPNTFIAGIYVGDKTKEQATEILKENLNIPSKLSIKTDNTFYDISSTEIDLSYNIEKSVDRAFYYPNKITRVFKPINLGAGLDYNQDKLDESLKIISSEIEIPPVYPTVSISNNNIIINKGSNGIEIDLDKTKLELLHNVSMQNFDPTHITLKNIDVELSQEGEKIILKRAQKLIDKKIDLNFEYYNFTAEKNQLLSFLNYGNSYDQTQIEKFIFDISNTLNRGPQNSVFQVTDGKVVEFAPSIDGVTVDEKALSEQIKVSLKSLEETEEKQIKLEIPVIKNPAKIKNEDVNDLGINTLIGRGVSYFRGSIANRVYNVNHASSKFKGILVAPGDIFSFDQVLGDVSALTGYKSAYIIQDGKTILGDGGGVCQVSTTMFRAALNAGLPITERRAHSYRVGYYEQGFPVGLDATVYYPTTDLKFINNTPAYILIQSEIDIPRSTLVFEIYGTDDGRVAKTTKPVITSSTAPPEDLYIDEPTLPTGTIKQIEHKAWGARVVFDYTVTRNGETLTQKTFVSNYQPWQAVYLRGTGPTQ